MNKHQFFSALVLSSSLSLLAAPNIAEAYPQGGMDRDSQSSQSSGKGGMHPGMMARELNLTREQEQVFHKVMRSTKEKIRAYKQQLKAEAREELSSVLSEDQLQAYDKLMEERQSRRDGMMGNRQMNSGGMENSGSGMGQGKHRFE